MSVGQPTCCAICRRRERKLPALPSEARLRYQLHRAEVGFNLKAACFQSSVFGSMDPAEYLASYALL